MKLALSAIREVTAERMTFAKQFGVKQICVSNPDLPGEGYWDHKDLVLLRKSVEDWGLNLATIQHTLPEWWDKMRFGLPGRDEQIENVQKTIRNLGAAGIRILGYGNIGVWRTSRSTRNRGGAQVTSFDAELARDAPIAPGGEISDEEMWDNYTYYLKAILPVAEEAGVKLALHPDDPPYSPLAGQARILRSFEAMKRAMDMLPSESHGLRFCQGTFAEMGEDVIEVIRYFGSRNKILYVHFRDVVGGPECFSETFHDNGKTDMLAAMMAYKEVGFDGPIMPDHVPHTVDDTRWGHRARSYAIGYMRALMQACGIEET